MTTTAVETAMRTIPRDQLRELAIAVLERELTEGNTDALIDATLSHPRVPRLVRLVARPVLDALLPEAFLFGLRRWLLAR